MTTEDILLLWEYLDKLTYITQSIVFLQFVLLGGLCALGFFAFWRNLL